MLEERSEENMISFEQKEGVLSFSCKVDHISSLLFQVLDVFQDRGEHFNNIHYLVSSLTRYNKDINIYCEKKHHSCSIVIVFFRNGNYPKNFLKLILKLKDELLSYERIEFVKIIPI